MEFERSFTHFFEECERGFINEVIVNLYTKIKPPGSTVISYQSIVKELYFIRSGMVEVFNNENDEIEKEKVILYLPKYAYFGEYQIMLDLKANMEYKCMSTRDIKDPKSKNVPDIIFMCLSAKKFTDLCDLFPQTAENIRVRAHMRRRKFLDQKNTNSKAFIRKLEEKEFQL